MTTTESTHAVPGAEVFPEAAPRVVSPSSSLSPSRSSSLPASLPSSGRRRSTRLAVETSEAPLLSMTTRRARAAKRKRESESETRTQPQEGEQEQQQEQQQQRSVRQNTQSHAVLASSPSSPALALHTPTPTQRALTTPPHTATRAHRALSLPVQEMDERETAEEEEDKSLQLARTHREMVRTSASLLRSLAFSLDFSVSLSHTHTHTQASASVSVDSYALLSQREFGIDRELARALSDRQREKEERRHLIMRDFFGQGMQPMFSRRERTKLVDSMLHIAKRFLFEPQIVFHAVSFVDQYLSRKNNINKHDLLEIGIAALMIAFKLDRGNRRKFPLMPILLYCHFEDARDREIFAKLVLAREVSVFSAIGLDPFNTPSLWEPLCEQLSVLSLPPAGGSSSSTSSLAGESDHSAKEKSSGETLTEKEREEDVSKLALCLCERVLFEYDLVMGYWPSTLVCAAIIIAQSIAGGEESVPLWSALLLQHTGLQAQDLLPCVLHVQRVLREESLSYAVVYAKKSLRESRARTTVKSGSDKAANLRTQTQTPTHERETESELASFFDYDEFIAMVERESSSSSSENNLSHVDRRAYLACLPGLLNTLLADSLLSCVFLDAHGVSESAGTSRCTTTESVAFSATFSPDRSAHTHTTSSSSSAAAVLSAFSPMLSFSPTPVHRRNVNNNTHGSAVCVKRDSDLLLQEEKERERERHQWLSLSRSLSRTIESVSEEEREPLKSVRLRHRSIYGRLVCCPPLY